MLHNRQWIVSTTEITDHQRHQGKNDDDNECRDWKL